MMIRSRLSITLFSLNTLQSGFEARCGSPDILAEEDR